MKELKRNLKIIALLLLAVITFTSCDFIKKLVNPAEPSKDKIATGETVDLGTKSVGSSGGEIIFTKSGDALDGLSIKVEDSSFTQSRDFKVEYNTIQSHKFNEFFIPISPMIKISNGGGYADRIIEVKVPAKVLAGEVPLAFFYDENTGKLEAVPVLTYDATSVTVGTRHFMTSSLHSSSSSKLMNSIQSENPFSKLIISSLKESVLSQKSLISTGFKPGTDDWEFVNYGSYIAPGGQCAGQSIGAMWYYLEKKSSSGQLFGKFRDNPKIWQSNPNGYRFCSTLQANLGDDTFVSNILRNYIRYYPSFDKLKFYTIASDMLITEEPVYISIAYEKGKDAKGESIYAGHALVCYAITPNEGKLFISDPNKPANEQIIELINDKFKPYVAKLNGADASHPFPFISFLGKSAMIEWDKIEDSYTKLLNGTIGNDKFPKYTVWVNDGSGYELKDGFSTDLDSLSISVFCPNAEVYDIKEGKRAISFNIYDEAGNQIDKDWEHSSSYIKLKPGVNKLGIYVTGWRESAINDNGSFRSLFLDFKWYNVTLNAIETYPATNITGMTATSGGNILSDNGFPITARGICWSTSPNPTIANSRTSDGSGIGSFTSILKDLTPETSYYIRAYATNSQGTEYGNQVSFKTITNGLAVGQNYGGGYIFYIDGTGQHGLICASNDQGYSNHWANELDTIYVGASGTAIGSGKSNSDIILSALGSSASAAKICDDYTVTVDGVTYSDWYLPSKDELNLMYTTYKADQLHAGFEMRTYWSSSEINKFVAWSLNFNGGWWYDNQEKSGKKMVRAIRSF